MDITRTPLGQVSLSSTIIHEISGVVSFINDLTPDISGGITLNNPVLADKVEPEIFDTELRCAFVDEDIKIVSKKRNGMWWTTDGETYTKCTASDGTDISSLDIRCIKKINDKYFAIINYAYYGIPYEIYVSDDGKTWTKTYTANLETNSDSLLGNVVYCNGYYYVPGDGINPTKELVEIDYNILYRSTDALNWEPVSIKWTKEYSSERPTGSFIFVEDDNHLVVLSKAAVHDDRGQYAAIRLKIADDGTISTDFIKRRPFGDTEPADQFFATCSDNNQMIIGGGSGYLGKIIVTKSGDIATDIVCEQITAYPTITNTAVGQAGKSNIVRDIVFANGKYYIASYYGEMYTLTSNLTSCSLVYTAPEGGEFNSVCTVGDVIYLTGVYGSGGGVVVFSQEEVTIRESLEGVTLLPEDSDTLSTQEIARTVNKNTNIILNAFRALKIIG